MRTLQILAVVMLAASSSLAQDFAGYNLPQIGIESERAISIVLGGRGVNGESFALTSDTLGVDWHAEITVGEESTTISKFGYAFSGSFKINDESSIELAVSGQISEPFGFTPELDDEGFHEIDVFSLRDFSIAGTYINQGREVPFNGEMAVGNARLGDLRVGYGLTPDRLVLDATGREYLSYRLEDSIQFEDDLFLKVIRVTSGVEMAQLRPAILGDSNLDGAFNSTDLVQVFAAGEYEDGVDGNSTWAEGDWNGDLEFNTTDMVDAFQAGTYSNAAVAVPEPSSILLALMSLVSFLQVVPRTTQSRSK